MKVDAEEFLAIFSGQFEKKPGVKITLQSLFRQLESWSSLQALMVTLAVHEKWNVSFTDEDFRSASTVNDLLQITESKLNS